MTNGEARVSDEEEVYRRIREKTPAAQLCFKADTGRVVFYQAAFNDPHKRPSVDRAILCGSNPHRARLSREDGIVALTAAAVRQIGLDQRVQAQPKHVIDVLPDPLDSNPAHAVIVIAPSPGSNMFKRLKEALARLATEAGWRVQPGVPVLRWNFLAMHYDAFRWVFRFLRSLK